MATLATRKNGSRFISFYDGCGIRKHITLGQTDKRYAQALKVRVEDLVSAQLAGHPPKDDTQVWLKKLDERYYSKLAAVGLVPDREGEKLGAVLDLYIDEKTHDLKPESLRKLERTREMLLEYFDQQTPVSKITPAMASAWRASLKEDGLSEATIKSHSGNAKTMVAFALKRKIISENPFSDLKSGSTASKYRRFVSADEIEKIIAVSPNAEWKLLFGLARYAGLRIPSETQGLTWSDVDFELGKLTVRSPKTERHAGHEQRVIPISPRLMELLQQRFDSADEGEERLLTIRGQGAVRRRVQALCEQAGVELWDRLWQTLRCSCEMDWANEHPQYAVSIWIGHSITVSGKHYANMVPDDLYAMAAGMSRNRAARRAAETA
jgi:integrase